jgi:hypothetical protein
VKSKEQYFFHQLFPDIFSFQSLLQKARKNGVFGQVLNIDPDQIAEPEEIRREQTKHVKKLHYYKT